MDKPGARLTREQKKEFFKSAKSDFSASGHRILAKTFEDWYAVSDVHTASSSNDVTWNMDEEWITEAEVRQRFPAAADASRVLQNAKQYDCTTMGRLFAIPKYTSSQQMRTSSQFKEQTKRELKGQVQGSPIAKRQRRAWGC